MADYHTHNTLDIQSLTKAHYLLQKGSDPTGRLYVVLHGFNSNAHKMQRRLQPRLPENANVLYLNGPYPIPNKEEQGYRVGYAWFFYDMEKREYLVGYDVCRQYVKNVVHTLGFQENPVTLIGYSQGGYASVHIAEEMPQVDHVIGMACQFVIDTYDWPDHLKVDAVHGAKDDVVDMDRAIRLFNNIPEKHRGHFEVFANDDHKPSVAMLDQVARWAQNK